MPRELTEREHARIDRIDDSGIMSRAYAEATVTGVWPRGLGAVAAVAINGEAPRDDSFDVDKEAAKEKGRPERLFDVFDREHFYPASSKELVEAHRLISGELVAGTATYLNEILRHQQKSPKSKERPEMPADTIRAVVRRITGYAENAYRERGFLLHLKKMIEDADEHQFAGLSSVRGIADWRYEASIMRPLVDLLRMQDAEALSLETGQDHLNDNYFSSDKETRGRVDDFIGSLRVGQTKALIEQRINQHTTRFDFWVNTLKEARAHAAAKDAVDAALDALRVKE